VTPPTRKKCLKESDGNPEKPGRDRLPFWLSFWTWLIAMAVYLLTLSPGVSWAHHSEDSGDLITSAWVLGIPHPTGYPLFCMTGWVWSHLVPLGSVAWRMNALSALWGALAAAITVRTVWTGFDLLSAQDARRLTRFARSAAALSSGLILAFATDVWSLSIVTEVYSLNLFFVALIGWILIELLAGARKTGGEADWEKRRGRLVALLGLSWGLALTNHLTSLFLFPGIALILAMGVPGLKFRELAKGVMWFALALLLYLYLPIRSAMNPPLDWGNPQTLRNFIWVVTGRQFRSLMFALMPFQMLGRIMRFSSIPWELGGFGALAAGLGACRLFLGKSRGEILWLVHTLLMVGSGLFYLASYHIWDPEGYLLPMIWASAVWAGWLLALVLWAPERLLVLARGIAVLILVLGVAVGLKSHWWVDSSGTYDAMQFGEESFASFDKNAVVLEVRYERAFTLWYYREVEYAGKRDDVAIVFVEHAGFDWGLDLLRRKYPSLVLPPEPITLKEKEAATAAWIIEHNIDKRPVYSGATVDALVEKGYRFEGVGLLYRVLPPVTE